MKKILILSAGIMLLAPAAFAANALPTVTTFTVPTSAVSPVPVTAFTATDSDGSVVAYLITESSTKPSATATGWSTTKPTSYATAKTGTLSLYAWAKDNSAGISATKSAATTLIGGHIHKLSDVVGLETSLAAKADASALSTKADVTALADKSDKIHNHDSTYQKKFANVTVVAKDGGDFTSIQSAIDALNPTVERPALIQVMPGAYSENVSISGKSYFHIQGAGKHVAKLLGNISVLSGTGVTISGLGASSIGFNTAANSVIRDNTGCISVDNSTGLQISDNEISTCDGPGIYVVRSTSAEIRNNTIIGNVPGSNGTSGIDIRDASGCNIVENTLSSFAQSAISVYNAPNSKVSGNKINGAGYGIYLIGSSIIAASNSVSGASIGLMISGHDGVVLSNNTVTGNEWGSYVYGGSTAVFNYNTLINNRSADVSITVDSTPVLISNTFNSTLGVSPTLGYIAETTAVGRFNTNVSGNPVLP